VVPKLKGATLARARLLLRRAHCALGKVSHRRLRGRAAVRAKHKPFEVITQSSPRGRHLRAGTKIRLTLERR
jgi:hypothetical protein